MDWKTTFDYIWQINIKEKQTNQLTPLDKEFYNDVNEFLIKLEAHQDTAAINAKTNVIKILNEIFERRKQKVLLYVAYKRPLPAQTPNIEHQLYNRLHEVLIQAGPLKDHQTETKISLEVVNDIPEVIMPNGYKIGPLSKGQQINIDNTEQIKFLLEAGICKQL